MREIHLIKKEMGDILSEKAYFFAFFLQLVIVFGIVYLGIMYAMFENPENGSSMGRKIVLIAGITGNDSIKDVLENVGFKVEVFKNRDEMVKKIKYGKIALGVISKNETIYVIYNGGNVLSYMALSMFNSGVEDMVRLRREKAIEEAGYDKKSILYPVQIVRIPIEIGEKPEIKIKSGEFIEIVCSLLVPLILILPVFLSMNMISDSIVGEKERKTFEMLLQLPLNGTGMFIAKIFPVLLFSMMQEMLWIGILKMEKIPIYNIILLLFYLFILNLLFTGVGVLISSHAENMKEANIFMSLMLFVATVLFFFPPKGDLVSLLSPVSTIVKVATDPGVEIKEISLSYALILIISLITIYLGSRAMNGERGVRA